MSASDPQSEDPTLPADVQSPGPVTDALPEARSPSPGPVNDVQPEVRAPSPSPTDALPEAGSRSPGPVTDARPGARSPSPGPVTDALPEAGSRSPGPQRAELPARSSVPEGPESTQAPGPVAAQPGLGALLACFLATGATAFGGGTIAHLRERVVRQRRWLDDDEFLTMIELSQTLPGINATNVAILIGDKLAGLPGAIAAGLGILVPGLLFVAALGVLVGSQGVRSQIAPLLKGVGAAAVGLLTMVAVQIGRKQLESRRDLPIVLVTWLAVAVFLIPLPMVLVGLGPLAIWLHRPVRS